MPPGILTVPALEQLVADYSEFDEFSVDVETKGPYRGDPRRNDVFWISLAGPGRADVIPCGHPLGERIKWADDDELHRISPQGKNQERRINPDSGREKWYDIPEPFTDPPSQLWISDVIECVRPLFFSPRRKIGQNVKFDIQSLAKYFGEMPPGPYADTLVAAKLINENEHAYRLGDQVKRAFKYEYDKIGKKGPELFPYSEAYLYSFLDAKYTWLLWMLYKEQLETEDVRHVFDMEMELLPAIIDMEWTGIAIDSDVLDDLDKEFSMEMADHQLAINDAAGWEVNLNAAAQISKLVYEVRKHSVRKFTEKTGAPSTAAADLEHYAKDPVVAKLLDYKKLGKLKSSFVDNIKGMTIDGRVHPSFNQAGTVTGRASCSEPNIQQIPSRSERGKRVRDVFVAQR